MSWDSPNSVECEYEDICVKECYSNCSKCANNKVAVKERIEELKKKDYFIAL